MHKEILRLLFQRGDFLSGEEISQKLGVSRAAVWKHIARLKEEGYEIEAVTRKGYRLVGKPEGLVYGWQLEQELQALDSPLWKRLVFQETLDSTNLEAKRQITDLLGKGEDPSGTVVVCEMQTAGRGRRGRSWVSPEGSGIWTSLILRPGIAPAKAPMLTLVAGLAVREALQSACSLDAWIKWPNDIIVGDRKICGILTEMTMEDLEMTGVVIGIGINVHHTEFPEELRAVATSAAMALGDRAPAPDRAALLMQVLSSFEAFYKKFLATEDLQLLQEEYNQHCINIGRTVQVIGPAETWSAKALGIDAEGGLILTTEDGTTRTVFSGEVTIRGVMGYAR